MAIQTKIQIRTIVRRHLADMHTPVSIYLKVRDQYSESVLLESTDFRSVENCFSFIGIQPIAKFTATGNTVAETLPDGTKTLQTVDNQHVLQVFKNFMERFEVFPLNPPKGDFAERTSTPSGD